MVRLKLIRTIKTAKSTIGELYVNDVFFCFTLEDVERKEKIYGETAISTGIYRVVLSMSPRFKRILPLLLDVPNYSGIRIHNGVHAGHTEGCILVGFAKGIDEIYHSRAAVDRLVEILSEHDEIEIEIT